MNVPETKYARSGQLHIAYQIVGQGTPLVVSDQWFGNVDAQWDFPPMRRFLERLASFARLVLFDKRGTGLSDPVPMRAAPSLEEWMDDLRAVLDDAGIDHSAILCGVGATYMGVLFAATYPTRTTALVIVNGYSRLIRTPDYPWGRTPEAVREYVLDVQRGWGTGSTMQYLAPSVADDEEIRRAFGRYERQWASPGAYAALTSVREENDVRQVLSAIRVPTLVMHRSDSRFAPSQGGRYISERIPGARYVEIPGIDTYLWPGDIEPIVGEVEEFLTGMRHVAEADRVLATVLFTDIVGSTERAAELGDVAWKQLLAKHDELVRGELRRFRGREIDVAGDGFLASFDGPARAIRCAEAIRDEIRGLDLEIRAGLHTGEVELAGERIRGIAVHIGARIASLARAGEVLVSHTVRDLVAGSGIEFENRGKHSLKGVPGEWRLFAAVG
jgi:class 3 adenylate cyclase/pimeloyl-ACP methyl ester carboxylesterase